MSHTPEDKLTVELKPFAHYLAAQPETGLRIEYQEGQLGVEWEGSEIDEVIFQRVFKLLIATDEYDDDQFLTEIVPAVEKLIKNSPLFMRLQSPDIVVTKAHTGITPYEHTLAVARQLKTDKLNPRDRVMLRLLAFYHDVGKGLSAGMSREKIQAAMQEHDHKAHSHPSHSELAVLMIRKLYQTLKDSIFVDKYFWQDLEFVTLEHHLFQDIQQGKITLEQVIEYCSALDIKNLALIFVLCRADLGSTEKHRPYWPDNIDYFVELFRQVEGTIDMEAAAAFLIALNLPTEFD
jgi:hypothetical protein